MTGEIIGAASAGVAVGRIVGETAKDIRASDNAIRMELVTAAKETEPFKQAAHIRAKRIALKEAAFLQVFRPIRKMLGISAEYFEHGFETDMAPRIDVIPEEHRVSPKASIAAPAMQGLAFSVDEPDLKKLYLDLLASASDARQIGSVHPAFVEVIRQLSAEEIPILTYPLGSKLAFPLARIVGWMKSGGSLSLISHLMEPVHCCPGLDVESEFFPTFLDNWVRLGLVEVSYTESLARAGAYDWIDLHPKVGRPPSEWNDESIIRVETKRGIMRPTDFGKAFAKAVGMEHSEPLLTYINEQVRTATAKMAKA